MVKDCIANLFKPQFQILNMTEAKSILKIKPAEVETIVIELARKNILPEKIGLILRDQHGIPKTKAITNKKISQILEENNFPINAEQSHISKRADNLKKHIEKHSHDYTAKRRLTERLSNLKKFK